MSASIMNILSQEGQKNILKDGYLYSPIERSSSIQEDHPMLQVEQFHTYLFQKISSFISSHGDKEVAINMGLGKKFSTLNDG